MYSRVVFRCGDHIPHGYGLAGCRRNRPGVADHRGFKDPAPVLRTARYFQDQAAFKVLRLMILDADLERQSPSGLRDVAESVGKRHLHACHKLPRRRGHGTRTVELDADALVRHPEGFAFRAFRILLDKTFLGFRVSARKEGCHQDSLQEQICTYLQFA